MKTMWLFPALVAGTISFQALASEDLGQAEIRELVRQGKILPLETILTQFPPKEYGKLLDLEVEREQRILDAYQDFRGALKQSEVMALEVLKIAECPCLVTDRKLCGCEADLMASIATCISPSVAFLKPTGQDSPEASSR